MATAYNSNSTYNSNDQYDYQVDYRFMIKDLYVERGADNSFLSRAIDSHGNPMSFSNQNPTTWIIFGLTPSYIQEYENGVKQFPIGVSVVNDQEGTFRINISADTTKQLIKNRYVYSIFCTNAYTGEAIKLQEGQILLD